MEEEVIRSQNADKQERVGDVNDMKEQQATDLNTETPEKSEFELSDLNQAIDKIRELSAALDAQNDRYMRLNADWENYRKRTEREKADARRYALENLFQALIPVLDSFEQAFPEDHNYSDTQEVNALVSGIQLVKKLFTDCLERHGLEAVGKVGEAFDPNIHQALQKLDKDDIAVETIEVVYRKGYKLNDRLVRAAEVVVAVPK